MAPRQFSAPKAWKRPYTSIYNDNYRYGNSLYSSALDDIERKYNESMAKTSYRSDRPDLGLSSMSGQGGHSAPPPSSSPLPGDSSRFNRRAGAFDSLDAEFGANRVSPTPHVGLTSFGSSELRKSSSFHAYQSIKHLNAMESSLEESRSRRARSRRRPESAYYSTDDYTLPPFSPMTPPPHTSHHNITSPKPNFDSVDAANQALWMDRCRELQSEVDRLNTVLIETESRIKSEAVTVKNKLNMEVTDLLMTIDEQERYTKELQSALKKQQRQIQDLQTGYDSVHRCYADSMEELSAIQRKASQLCHEVDNLRSSIDKVSI